MSKDSFKVKNGLTLTPIDPSEIVNPQAGDLIADSTDDNKIKRYDATSADWSSVGGSAGIGGNLMAEFEKLTPDLVNVTSAVDTVTFLPIDDNNKSIKATWSGSVGSIQFQVPVDSSLHEIQGTVSVWIKTSLNNIQVSSVQDDVKLSTLPVSGTGKWKQYELPVVVGGAEMGFIVESTTGVTGDVYIDQPFVGLTPSSYGFEVAQVESAESFWQGATNCVWQAPSNSTTYQSYTADNDCNNPVVSGFLKVPSSKKPSITLPAGSKAGTYEITFVGSFLSNTGSGNAGCYYRLFDGTNTAEAGASGPAGNSEAGSNHYHAVVTGSMTYTSNLTVDTTIEITARSFSNNTCQIANDASPRDFKAIVKYYPPKTTIVTQTQEETVETANEFSAKVSGSAVVSDQSLNWISGCSKGGTGIYSCNFNSNIFTVAPNCVITPRQPADTNRILIMDSISSSSVSWRTAVSDSSPADTQEMSIICQKQGADYNKSRLIVGQFEQIKSTELCQVEAYGNSGDTITAGTEDIPFATKLKDNCNAWTNAGNTGGDSNDAFTPIRDGAYSITLSVDTTAALHTRFYLYENGVYYKEIAVLTNAGIASIYPMSGTFFLKAGNVYTIRMGQTMTLENALPQENHYINIKELGDVAAIVKNLNDNKNVKCQTKFLSANYIGTSTIADLTFSNLTIGKKYKFHANFFGVENGFVGSNVIREWYIRALNGATILGNMRARFDSQAYFRESRSLFKHFTATDTSLTFFQIYNQNTATEAGAAATYVTLCELPDNYIETDEW